MFERPDEWIRRWQEFLSRHSDELDADLRRYLLRLGMAAYQQNDRVAMRNLRLAVDRIVAHHRKVFRGMSGMAYDDAGRFDGMDLRTPTGGTATYSRPSRREFDKAMRERTDALIATRMPVIEAAVARTLIVAREAAGNVISSSPPDTPASEIRATIEEKIGTESRNAARVISETETHAAAIRAQKDAVDALGLPVDRKTWWATNDHRTRQTHREAHRQTRPIDEPFTVGGFSLMIPGDSSMGAPLSEIINCRCGVVYEVAE